MIAFIEYLDAVDEQLERQYGITTGDVDLALVASCQEENWTAWECVVCIAEKYDLVPISKARSN